MTTFATLKRGCEVVGKSVDAAHALWRDGDAENAVVTLNNILSDIEVLRQQATEIRDGLAQSASKGK